MALTQLLRTSTYFTVWSTYKDSFITGRTVKLSELIPAILRSSLCHFQALLMNRRSSMALSFTLRWTWRNEGCTCCAISCLRLLAAPATSQCRTGSWAASVRSGKKWTSPKCWWGQASIDLGSGKYLNAIFMTCIFNLNTNVLYKLVVKFGLSFNRQEKYWMEI